MARLMNARAVRALVIVGLLLALSACGSATKVPTGIVRGRVVSAPTCPVERLRSPCPPRPVVGADVVATDQGRVVGQTRSGASGRFTLSLPRGRHLITAYNVGPLRTSAAVSVVVGASPRSITLTVDSGIR